MASSTVSVGSVADSSPPAMTAPLSISRPIQGSSGSAISTERVPACTIERVVSVSPKHAATAPGSEPFDRAGAAAERGFITPRVIDQATFDELAQTLRAIIEEAAAAGRRLTAQIGQADASDARAVKASQDLQERLRLGARMLAAFQSQIARLEALIAEIDQRERVAAESDSSAAGAQTALATFEAEVKRVIADAEQRIDRRLSEIPTAIDEANGRLAESLHALATRIHPDPASEGRVHLLREAELSAGAD